jgi:hypothetical protein
MAPIFTGLKFGFGKKIASSAIGGFIVQISPAISGKTLYNLDTESLIFDGGTGTSYTLTVSPSSTESTGTIQVDAWGEATASSPAGYAGGFISMTPSSTFAVRLNTGPGPGGSISGSGISPRGGGYAGIFSNNTVNQANALLIAGGGGGGGSSTGGNDNDAGEFFGSGGSKIANFGLGARFNPQLSYGGRGGSQSAGGTGGSGGGGTGSALQGGTGGAARSGNNASGGGGGGGGYYGGGGGAGGYDDGGGTRPSANGGGGSSFVSPTVQRGQIHYFTAANQPLRGSAGQKTSNQSSYRNSLIVIKKAPGTLPPVLSISYTGQDSVTTDGDWRIIRWTSPGTITVSNASPTWSSSVDFLSIGGGGGGGGADDRAGGGGGGAEFKQGSAVLGNGPYTVTVGSGGGQNTKGGSTSISGVPVIFADGGGRGGAGGGTAGSSSGGGGGAGQNGSGAGAPGGFQPGGSGYDGGDASNGVFLGGGGGGLDYTPNGVGRNAGISPPLSAPPPFGPGRAGDGGNGITSDLFGVSGCAGGGGGAQGSPGRGADGAGVGGSPGGGRGAIGVDGGGTPQPVTNGTTFGSGGGGSASSSASPPPGGSGYPGVLFIRYRFQ